jgi:hypothetical protein
MRKEFALLLLQLLALLLLPLGISRLVLGVTLMKRGRLA